jgi:hypothetical protein
MSAGWVLVQTRAGAAATVAAALVRVPGEESAEHTQGAYDIVARVADAGAEPRAAKRVVQAALRLPDVTLAVGCQQGSADPIDLLAHSEAELEPYPSSVSDGHRDLPRQHRGGVPAR